MTEDQIKHMVDRFLSWTLPDNFRPDGGISHRPADVVMWPSGTNLFDATQATKMVRYMVEGLPSTPAEQAVHKMAECPYWNGDKSLTEEQ